MFKDFLDIDPKVEKALEEGVPVIALESAMMSHDMPCPQSAETILKAEEVIKEEGAMPATVGIIRGRIRIGLTKEEIRHMAAAEDIQKVSRCDFPAVISKQASGATTVAGTKMCIRDRYVSGLGILFYTWLRRPDLRIEKRHRHIRWKRVKEIGSFSFLTCLQQSVMNLGILMVQGLVNSFGPAVMAAFAAAVKIDSFAYMPVQDFGNAFSTFIGQNYGAQKEERIREGLRGAVTAAMLFSFAVSVLVWIFARPLMLLFVDSAEEGIIEEGVRYLRIEGAFYCGIGCLFLLYGLYRALGRPGMSVILTVLSLGTRVALAYILSAIPSVGVTGIWWSVPIGWALADSFGFLYYRFRKKALFPWENEVRKTGREKK